MRTSCAEVQPASVCAANTLVRSLSTLTCVTFGGIFCNFDKCRELFIEPDVMDFNDDPGFDDDMPMEGDDFDFTLNAVDVDDDDDDMEEVSITSSPTVNQKGKGKAFPGRPAVRQAKEWATDDQLLLGKANCEASWASRCGQRWVMVLRRV